MYKGVVVPTMLYGAVSERTQLGMFEMRELIDMVSVIRSEKMRSGDVLKGAGCNKN